MAPIRVGLIGLTGAPPDKYESTSWARNAHLPFLKKSPHFEVTALLNTSVESAKTAIERNELPTQTKAYGRPEDLAADPDIDLVVCSVRVDRHFKTVKPSIIAGKTVYAEWPLERNAEVTHEMASLAAKHNAKTIVGLQGTFSPIIRKMKAVIDGGKIGKVLSSSVVGAAGNMGPTQSKNVRYFLDREVGGSVMSIHLGHALEFVTGVFESFESLIAVRRDTIDIVDPSADNKVVDKAARNTVPDQIMFHGTTAPLGTVVSVALHGGSTFPGVPGLQWRVQGEKGEIHLSSRGFALNVGTPELKLQVLDLEGGKVEELHPDDDEWSGLPLPAQNIARLYEAYRKGEWYPDFEWAIKRHDLIDEMWKKYDR